MLTLSNLSELYHYSIESTQEASLNSEHLNPCTKNLNITERTIHEIKYALVKNKIS